MVLSVQGMFKSGLHFVLNFKRSKREPCGSLKKRIPVTGSKYRSHQARVSWHVSRAVDTVVA